MGQQGRSLARQAEDNFQGFAYVVVFLHAAAASQ